MTMHMHGCTIRALNIYCYSKQTLVYEMPHLLVYTSVLNAI